MILVLLSNPNWFYDHPRSREQPCVFGWQRVLWKLSIKHEWNLSSQSSPETLDGRVIKSSLNSHVISSWWEGFACTMNSPNSPITLAAIMSITHHKESVKWENCGMLSVWYPQSESNLQLWHCFWNLLSHVTKDSKLVASPAGHWSESMMTVYIRWQIK